MLTKAELISELSADSEFAKVDVDRVLQSLATVTAKALAAGKEVTLPGIGKLKPVERKARAGRNPATGEAIQIAASRGVKLAVAGELKKAIG